MGWPDRWVRPLAVQGKERMEDLDDIVREFLVESHENLDELDRALVELEQQPDSRDLLSGIFRTIHTIKGTSGFLAFSGLEALTHAGEGLLAKLRDGDLALDREITDGLLRLVDAVRMLLRAVEESGSEGEPDHADLIATLTALQEARPAEAAPVEAAQVEAPQVEAAPAAPPAKKTRKRRRAVTPLAPVPPRKPEPEPEPEPEPGPPARIGEVLVNEHHVPADDVEVASMEQRLGDSRRIGEILVEQGQATAAQVNEALAAQHASTGKADHHDARSLADATIRVDVALLDSVMRLVGELVLTRNQIVATALGADPAMARAAQRLNLLVSELQEGVMKTRMQAIDTVWNKFPRVVRDLGVSCGKQVRLEMEGRDTELDKTILEAIKDPLTHIVRNSVDHGIETPEARVAAGKPAEGLLRLSAFHESGQVTIEISDDGAGIDVDAVASKALERGIVTAEQVRLMSQRELTNLVFMPGFSTAAKVTNVSGRGVGMDVVRTNIEDIGGTVDIVSDRGAGTTIRVKIPLTLAIIPALTIACGGQRYAVPQVNLVELLCLEGDRARDGVEFLSGAPVYRLRGDLLPLVWLDHVLELRDAPHVEDTLYIAVLQAEGQQFGVVVDQVLNSEEIVVKPLSRQLKGIGTYAGATILGDGRVALILDVRSLAHRAHVVAEHAEGGSTEAETPIGSTAVNSGAETLLIVGCGERRVGIPLPMVTRLEEIDPSRVERAGSGEVVRYRGHIMPLMRLGRLIGESPMPVADGDQLKVIVHTEGDRSVGIVVDSVLDIASDVPGSRDDAHGIGIAGVAVVQERVTELLDMEAAIRAADPNFFERRSDVQVTA